MNRAMAISALSVAVSNPRLLPSLPKSHKAPPFLARSASSLHLSLPAPSLPVGDPADEAATASTSSSSSSLAPVPSTSRRLFGVGVGILAASSFASDARATRIEYYATVGEPLCDMNFARSGLGYCDVAIGTGVEAPRGELINVSLKIRSWTLLRFSCHRICRWLQMTIKSSYEISIFSGRKM